MLSSFDSLLSAHLDFTSKLMSTFLVSVGVCVALSVLYESVYHHLNKRPRHEIYDEIFISCKATPLSPAWFNDQRVVCGEQYPENITLTPEFTNWACDFWRKYGMSPADVFTTKHYPMWCLSCNQTMLCSQFHPHFVCTHECEYGECRLPDFSCQCHT